MNRFGRTILWRLALPLAVVAVWQAAVTAGLLHPALLPPPSTLIRTAGKMASSGELARNIWATFRRALLGFLLGAIPGIALGVLGGRSRKVRAALDPVFASINSTPRMVQLPLLLVLIGINDTARILLVAIGTLVVICMHTMDAIRAVQQSWVDIAVNYGVRGWSLLRDVYFPACLPHLFTGIRTTVSRALTVEISAELLSSTDGLGALIWMAWQTFSIDRLLVSIAVTAAIGGLIHEALILTERRMVPWRT